MTFHPLFKVVRCILFGWCFRAQSGNKRAIDKYLYWVVTGISHSPLGGRWPQGLCRLWDWGVWKNPGTCAVASQPAAPPPQHLVELLARPDHAQRVSQRLVSPSPTASTCWSESVSFASFILHAYLHVFTDTLIWWLVVQSTNSSFIVKGLSCPAAFCHLGMLPQPRAKAWPRLKEDTNTFLFMISLPEKRILSQFMQITMQISTAHFITVSCQNVDAKLHFIINARSKNDFNKCLRKHLFPRAYAGPMGAFV